VMYAHLSEPPPPVTSRQAGLPPAVDQVVARAMAKVPADRYASCQEFADALLQALGTESPSSRLGASDGPAPSHPSTQIDLVSDGSGRQPALTASAAAGTAHTPHAEADMPSRDIDIPAASAAADTAAPVSETAPVPAPVDPATGHAAAGPDAAPDGTATPGRPARDDQLRPLEPGPVRRPTSLSPSRAKRSRSRLLLLTVASAAIIAASATALFVSLSGGASAPSGPAGAASGHGGAALKGALVATLRNPESSARADGLAFGPSARTLVVGSVNNNGNASGTGSSTYVWDMATKTITATLTDPGSAGVDSVAYGPGGTTLAAADSNGSTYLWDIATKTITATLTDPDREGVYYVAFGPGGTTLAAADSNGNAYLWKIASHKS